MALAVNNLAHFPNNALPTFLASGKSYSKSHADATSVTATDTGITPLNFIRVRIVVKSGMSNTNTVIFVVRVGTSTNVTAPEVVITSPTMTFVTGDGTITYEGWGWSNNGFQSYKIDVTNSGGAASFDAIVDCF